MSLATTVCPPMPGVGIAMDIAAGTLSAAPLAEPEVYRSIAIGVPRAGPVTLAALRSPTN